MIFFYSKIFGEPVGEGRPRAVRIGPRVRVHAAPKSAQWRAVAAQQMAEEWGGKPAVLDCCEVSIAAFMSRPQSRPKDISKEAWQRGLITYRRQKPDVDNIAKAVLDAIVQAGIIGDDAQVTHLHVKRLTCDLVAHLRPCIRIHIRSIGQKHESPDTGSDWANEAP